MTGGSTESQQKPEEKPQEIIELNDIEEIDLPDDIESFNARRTRLLIH